MGAVAYRVFTMPPSRLAILGSIAFLGYLAINVLMPLSPRLLMDVRAELIHQLWLWIALTELPLPVPQTDAALMLLATVCALVVWTCYVLALWFSRGLAPTPGRLGVVLGVMVLSCLTSVLTLPHSSHDLYMYILYERVITVYHANPYTTPPAVFVGDPYLRYGDQQWIWSTMFYGPVWAFLSSLWGPLAGDNLADRLLLYRTVLFGVNLANVALLWHLLGRLQPANRLFGLLVYAWNPIMIVAGQKHTEPVMVFFLLAGVWLYAMGRPWLAGSALLLSTLTKVVAAPLLVTYVGHAGRRWPWRRILLAASVFGCLMLLAVVALPAEFVARLRENVQLGETNMLTNPRRLLAYPVLAAGTLWLNWRSHGTLPEMLRTWSIILLGFGFFVMPPQSAWYLLPLIGVVGLVTSRTIVVLTLALCGSALWNYLLGAVTVPPRLVIGLIWWAPSLLALLWLGRLHSAPQVAPRRRWLWPYHLLATVSIGRRTSQTGKREV